VCACVICWHQRLTLCVASTPPAVVHPPSLFEAEQKEVIPPHSYLLFPLHFLYVCALWCVCVCVCVLFGVYVCVCVSRSISLLTRTHALSLSLSLRAVQQQLVAAEAEVAVVNPFLDMAEQQSAAHTAPQVVSTDAVLMIALLIARCCAVLCLLSLSWCAY
jgi:hypothetical protein